MKATVEYIEQKFNIYNKLIFAGRLPQIPFELSDAKTFVGKCVYKFRIDQNGKRIKYDFKIRISTRFDLEEEELDDTIIHEMIHYHIGINQLEDTSSHGPLFLRMMNNINIRFGRHLTVSHKTNDEDREQLVDPKVHYHVIATVKFKNGKFGIKVLPRVLKTILNYHNKVKANNDILEIKLYMSNNVYFNQYPNSGALKVHYVDEVEINEKLKDAELMKCDGKSIIRNK